jgi:hypothetical protein
MVVGSDKTIKVSWKFVKPVPAVKICPVATELPYSMIDVVCVNGIGGIGAEDTSPDKPVLRLFIVTVPVPTNPT